MIEKIIKIPITGSSGAAYEVVFHLTEDGLLKIKCTCRAGIFGPFCKHRMALLAGDLSAAAEPINDWPLIESWISNSEFLTLAQEFQVLKHESDILEKKFKNLKGRLGEKMKFGVPLIPKN